MSDQEHWLAPLLTNVPWRRTTEVEDTEKTEKNDLHRVLLDFLEVLDSLDRLIPSAASGARQSKTSDWPDHLQAVRKQLLATFERAGVTFFDSAGQPFDPGRHEAVEAVQRCDVDDYTVVEEIARGCEWRGEVLRFARVVVARSPE